jgi:hypothetical protein
MTRFINKIVKELRVNKLKRKREGRMIVENVEYKRSGVRVREDMVLKFRVRGDISEKTEHVLIRELRFR